MRTLGGWKMKKKWPSKSSVRLLCFDWSEPHPAARVARWNEASKRARRGPLARSVSVPSPLSPLTPPTSLRLEMRSPLPPARHPSTLTPHHGEQGVEWRLWREACDRGWRTWRGETSHWGDQRSGVVRTPVAPHIAPMGGEKGGWCCESRNANSLSSRNEALRTRPDGGLSPRTGGRRAGCTITRGCTRTATGAGVWDGLGPAQGGETTQSDATHRSRHASRSFPRNGTFPPSASYLSFPPVTLDHAERSPRPFRRERLQTSLLSVGS